jgi:hypothetical protein
MKTQSLKHGITLLALLLFIGFSSCKKNADTDTVITSDTETVGTGTVTDTTTTDTVSTDTTSTSKPLVKKNSEDGTNSAL